MFEKLNRVFWNKYSTEYVVKKHRIFIGVKPVTLQFITLVTYVKHLNHHLIINIWKKAEKKERDLNWMEDFKIESRFVKLCYELRAFTRCLETAFYRPDFQKFLIRWSKDLAEHLWCVARFCTICTIWKTWKTPMEEC